MAEAERIAAPARATPAPGIGRFARALRRTGLGPA